MSGLEYCCAECGAPVEVKSDGAEVELIRSCEHAEAAVLLSLQAVCTGEGSAS